MESNETGQGPSDETVNPNEAPSQPFPAPEHTPTREEAREMFRANPGLWAVLTDTGNMTRDET